LRVRHDGAASAQQAGRAARRVDGDGLYASDVVHEPGANQRVPAQQRRGDDAGAERVTFHEKGTTPWPPWDHPPFRSPAGCSADASSTAVGAYSLNALPRPLVPSGG
ncbi:MAG: hypothetical protein ACREXR_24280, partial [Gammaproteobacteria bacterium]